jgi:hypothetical protein
VATALLRKEKKKFCRWIFETSAAKLLQRELINVGTSLLYPT